MTVNPPKSLPWTNNAAADRLLAEDSLALLIGMLLDQQFPMERAFFGPYLLRERLGGPLDAGEIAEWDPEEFAAIFRGPPAIHRYPASMAKRTQALCRTLVDEYDGVAERLWKEAGDGRDLYKRLKSLPGYGEMKSRVFVGILGKRMGIQPPGWEDEAAQRPSIADVARWEDVAELREMKREMKKAAKAKG
ncbi:MAG: Fe-S cluster assembly protein HesB [Acidimicrobiia bacterium]|nr:Fe-S cluster assembly protein HesB [bacterium]MXX45070.1 Fe-S cluster assembly protein HesB [Acidimicrobiia bacterium]MXY74259.1 Fe-S cluster assembly protein HesB [Acidimicrobiia bacterium]MYD41091.1 Fe-S cluster assembly protein HesB [Acidimicrobiia bacterium]MYH05123.1 Fe-S cluster assembly protein HesB [Acidimicrobiia bacterium]